ncbi:uncharacterized protein K452DRAFT_321107 [Aplosporella prunicola CBS 121167]|uniref:Gram-positive cocci surface proteins LPxTG domain-containing protein n=1 Tax=Aplosporella prunicola CBS 121167 TaxID=1176127 RepID=A0A6A6B6W1_9PEZI|nr:uncharacterized protein K452DRAFT_321107 [Aplosporella prunicola CBS 121167]KAF2138541.1 hypothetical protein K452DRAFT_321107 [Aplosporella prunicola CBS 121167]
MSIQCLFTGSAGGQDGARKGNLSGGIIAGIVLGALSVLLLITGAYIFLRRRKQHNQPQSPSEKPIGGRHELSAESSDPSKHLSEAEAVGTMVNEMHVPPHEAGGAAVHELAAEEPAVEVGVGDGDAGSGGRASVEDRRV